MQRPKAVPDSTSEERGRRSGPVTIFYSYAHEDEDLRQKLANHLANLRNRGVIRETYDRNITAGEDWAGKINEHLEEADVILLLVSSDFLASRYINDVELRRAMERHDSGEARVIPVILRPVDWRGAPFGQLQALPRNAKPVTSWEDMDSAFTSIAEGIREVVENLPHQRLPASPEEPPVSSASTDRSPDHAPATRSPRRPNIIRLACVGLGAASLLAAAIGLIAWSDFVLVAAFLVVIDLVRSGSRR